MEEGQARGVRVQNQGDDGPRQITARVVVDATGQQALIANRLGLRVENPRLKKAAIWGYYRGARRDPGEHGGATVILHSQTKKAWFWYIPLPEETTSIGVVADHSYLLKGRGKPADVFEDELVQCPALVNRLMDAELVSEFRVAKEFSYTTTQHSGDGWVLVGDAWGFIDPIYSSGVFFALKSGELASDSIISALRDNDVSAQRLGAWFEEFNAGTRWIRKLVEAFYAEDFSFGKFMKEHPQHQANLTDLLIGRIFYDGAGRMFEDMSPLMQRCEETPASQQAMTN
jgi:flavin-dependent dehydrogenase